MSITFVGAFGYDPVSPPEGQNIVTTTRSHSNRTVVDAVEACDPSEILRAGGAGHKVKSLKYSTGIMGISDPQSGHVSIKFFLKKIK